MPHLYVSFQPVPQGFTLDVLVARIIEQFPGAKITAENWFADRRMERERVHEMRKQQGHATQFREAILASLDQNAESCGPTKEISIPIGDEKSLSGRISLGEILLHSDVPIDEIIANRFLAVFRTLGIITKEIQVSDLHSRRRRSRK